MKLWRQKSWPFGPGWAAELPRICSWMSRESNSNFLLWNLKTRIQSKVQNWSMVKNDIKVFFTSLKKLHWISSKYQSYFSVAKISWTFSKWISFQKINLEDPHYRTHYDNWVCKSLGALMFDCPISNSNVNWTLIMAIEQL